MKFILLLILICAGSQVSAKNYYFNPSSPATEANGSITAPFKGFEPLHDIQRFLRGGDSLLLKRGEIFFETLTLTCNGTAENPIVITGYGAGARPTFIYKAPTSDNIQPDPFAIRIYKSNYLKFMDLDVTDDHIDAANHSSIALIKIAFSIDESNFITIQKCDISLVGIGVNIVGDHNFVNHCVIKNLRMVRNTHDGGYDDYGANGIVLAGADNIISNCSFLENWANSYDFDYDGGAIEMAGSTCKRNKILNNFAMDCNGFMELGSTDAGVIEQNLVEGNTILNCSGLFYINNDGPYAVDVRRLQFVDNIIIQTFPQFTKPDFMMGLKKKTDKSEVIILKNNIFWLSTPIDVARPAQFSGSEMIHTENIYYVEKGKLNFPLDKSEQILTSSSQVLSAFLLTHKQLSLSAFPFKYLLQYWFLLF